MKRAIIKNGVVVNVVIGTEEDFPGSIAVDDIPQVSKGWLYADGVFAPPEEPEPTEWKITHLEFLELFTPAEILAVEAAKASDPQVQVAHILFGAAKEIDLMYPPTMQYVNYLESISAIGDGRAAEILSYRGKRQ